MAAQGNIVPVKHYLEDESGSSDPAEYEHLEKSGIF